MSKGGFVQNNFKPFRIGESGPTTFILNKGESNMNLSQEIEKIVKQVIQDHFASQRREFSGDVEIEVKLNIKSMTGNIVAVRDGEPIMGDRFIADTEIKASKITENNVHKKAVEAFDELILRYGFVVMSEVAKSKI